MHDGEENDNFTAGQRPLSGTRSNGSAGEGQDSDSELAKRGRRESHGDSEGDEPGESEHRNPLREEVEEVSRKNKTKKRRDLRRRREKKCTPTLVARTFVELHDLKYQKWMASPEQKDSVEIKT